MKLECERRSRGRRRRLGAFLGAALATGVLGAPSASVQAHLEVHDLSPALAEILAKHDVPGIVAAIVEDGEVVAVGAAGVRQRGEKDKVTVADRFHIGSCTKAMTATLAATFVEQGRIRWDTTLAQALPDQEMHADWRGVTLEQLLTHRAGAPADLDRDGLWARLWAMGGEPIGQRRALADGVLEHPPVAPPGTKYLYSNAGVALAGVMLETLAGKPWEELMRTRLFQPLGMGSAGFGAPGSAERIDEPRGHRGDGTPVRPGPGSDNPPAIGPAGTVHCSIGDWAKFAAAHALGETGRSKLLEAKTFVELHTPPEGSEPKYALGWLVGESRWAGGRVLTHRGSNTMWLASVWVAPEKGLAFLVCSNQASPAAERAHEAALAALLQGRTARAIGAK